MAKATVSKTSALNDNSVNTTSFPAGIAGAGIGTLMVSLAKNLPDDTAYKSWMVIAAPTIAVVVSWMARRVEIYWKRKQVTALKKKMKEKISELLDNPILNDKEKEKLQREIVDIDMAEIETLEAKIKSINTDINK